MPPQVPERRMRRIVGALGLGFVLVLGPSASAQFRWREARPVADVVRAVAPDDVIERAPVPLAPARHHIPLSGGAKHLIVQGTLNDLLSGPMLIDTGASYCVVTRKTAQRLGLVRVGTKVPVASVQIEDARLGGIEAVVMDAVEPPLVGILGLSFLNQFRRYSVDQARGTIQLER